MQQKTIKWCMLTQIWSAIIFSHFRPFFAFTPLVTPKIKTWKNVGNTRKYYPFMHMHHKSRSYVWFLRYKVQRTKLFVILGHFLPFHPPNNPKNQNFEKIKKNTWKYDHFTFVYHKWWSYDVRLLRVKHDRLNFLSLWAIYCLFNPITAQKIKIKKKRKKHLDHHFTHVYQKLWLDGVRFLRYGVQQADERTDIRADGKVTYRNGCPT